MSSSEQYPEERRPEARQEVLIDPSRQVTDEVDLADMDLDRIPDREGMMRFLVSPDQLEGLRSRRVVLDVAAAVPVRGLDPDLIYSDEAAAADLERRLEGIERDEGGS